MATIHQRRKADRERQKRWRKKKLAEGKKQIHIMLTPEAQEVIERQKDRTGETYVEIINRLIVEKGKDLPDISEGIEVWSPG